MLTVGAVTSPTVTLLTDTVTELLVLLFAASLAVTVNVCVPFATVAEFQVLVNGAVLLLLIATPSTERLTDVTATLSLALTCTADVPVTEEPDVGEMMLMVGAVASRLPLAATIDKLKTSLPASGAFDKNPEETIKGTFAYNTGLSSTTPETFAWESSVSLSGTAVDFSLEQDAHRTDTNNNPN